MKNLIKLLINTVLPPRCLHCGKIINNDNSLCSDCFEQISFITKPYCIHCGAPLLNKSVGDLYCANCLNKKDNLRYCRSAVIYDDFSKKLILDFKFFDHVENKKLLAKWLYLAGKDIFEAGVDVIIPVPLHYLRLLKRKYNQSAILADELSRITNIEADYHSLVKTKTTQPQAECSGRERVTNIKNAFVVKNNNIKGKRVLLIDDVFTTGSTLRECAKVLKKAGAVSVDALTVAKVC